MKESAKFQFFFEKCKTGRSNYALYPFSFVNLLGCPTSCAKFKQHIEYSEIDRSPPRLTTRSDRVEVKSVANSESPKLSCRSESEQNRKATFALPWISNKCSVSAFLIFPELFKVGRRGVWGFCPDSMPD